VRSGENLRSEFPARSANGDPLEVEVDLGAAVGAATFRVVLAGFGEVGSARLAGSLGDGDDLAGGDASLDEVVADDVGTALGKLGVVVRAAERVGVAAEGDFFAGIGLEDKSDDLELATGERGQ
jgi:hypothetical protein